MCCHLHCVSIGYSSHNFGANGILFPWDLIFRRGQILATFSGLSEKTRITSGQNEQVYFYIVVAFLLLIASLNLVIKAIIRLMLIPPKYMCPFKKNKIRGSNLDKVFILEVFMLLLVTIYIYDQ